MVDPEETLPPGLYLVATPLGNLGDLSLRAREVLSRASFWAAESRQSAWRWLEILKPPRRPHLLSYRDGAREADSEPILRCLEEGGTVALISDAGTPCLSDPGWHLVDLARQRGVPVWSLPGPCAAVLALTLAGFPCRRFLFEGFLPAAGKARREALARIAEQSAPVVLYESPHHLLATLSDLATLEERALYIGRELTKKFEESWRGTTGEALAAWRQREAIKGELTLVLGPRAAQIREVDGEVPEATLELVRSLGLPTKTARTLLLHFFPEADKKSLYQRLSRPEEGTGVR